MKTKFTPLVRVKKEALDRVEREILLVNRAIEAHQELIAQAVRDIAALAIPEQGAYADFLRVQAMKKVYIEELEQHKLELAELRARRGLLQEQLKALGVELEKAKYLDKLEVQKMIALQKRQESLELDEISLLLYNARQGEGMAKEGA